MEGDDSDVETNSRIEQTLAQGKYWLEISSFTANEISDHNIAASVIIP